MAKHTKIHNDPDFVDGYFVVGLLDIMGQRTHIEKLREPPHSQADYESRKRIIASTVGELTILRDQLQRSFPSDDFDDFKSTAEYKALNLEQRKLLEDTVQSNIGFQFFSDTLVLHAPIVGYDSFQRVWDVYSILVACSVVLLDCFSRGVAIRGGIELAIALRWKHGEIYGPAFQDAYDLEHNCADFPRVVVGDGLIEFLRRHATNDVMGMIASNNRKLASDAFRFLDKEQDGLWYIDWMGSYIAQKAKPVESEAVRKAVAFIQQEYDRFRSDNKLGPRYKKLLGYCESRGDYWSI